MGLLQKPGASETDVAFGPSKPAPPVTPEAGFAGEVASRLEEALGSETLPSAEKPTAPLDRISDPQKAHCVLEALQKLTQDDLVGMTRDVVAARVGSTAPRGDDAPVVAYLGRELRVRPAPALWLTRDYLQHYPKARLIRLALDSGAVPPADAESLEDLTRDEIIERILESDSRDEDYVPPELSFADA